LHVGELVAGDGEQPCFGGGVVGGRAEPRRALEGGSEDLRRQVEGDVGACDTAPDERKHPGNVPVVEGGERLRVARCLREQLGVGRRCRPVERARATASIEHRQSDLDRRAGRERRPDAAALGQQAFSLALGSREFGSADDSRGAVCCRPGQRAWRLVGGHAERAIDDRDAETATASEDQGELTDRVGSDAPHAEVVAAGRLDEIERRLRLVARGASVAGAAARPAGGADVDRADGAGTAGDLRPPRS